jgi:hypothetical protein
MAIDLLKSVASFDIRGDRETSIAFFRTHVPWVGSAAYLHVVYKPAPKDLVLAVAEKLRMPETFVQFLYLQNGADLFAGALSIFGAVPAGQLLNRTDPFSLPPFSIENENSGRVSFDRDRFLAVGGYGFDASTVCIDRENGLISLFPPDLGTPSFSWPNFEDWISSEIARLFVLFDRSGKRLVEGRATLPPTKSSKQ